MFKEHATSTKLSGKKWEGKVDRILNLTIEFRNKKTVSFVAFSDLIDEVVGLGINKRFGAPFGDGTLLHEWSRNSNLSLIFREY